MKRVSRETIEEVWDRLCNADKKESDATVKRFMQEQPALGVYPAAQVEEDEEIGNRPLIELAVACWQAMSQTAGKPLASVPPERIEEAEEANTRAIEKLEEVSEMEREDAVKEHLAIYNQQELLGFAIEVLMSDNEETPELAPDCLGLEMLTLGTVIDCPGLVNSDYFTAAQTRWTSS